MAVYDNQVKRTVGETDRIGIVWQRPYLYLLSPSVRVVRCEWQRRVAGSCLPIRRGSGGV
ncbi:MAG TPA: hypothetical protein VKV26_13220 [Dehalococcoidia bacterium]|nr:hypothetical protein [Dehalococcoidia bacterium]